VDGSAERKGGKAYVIYIEAKEETKNATDTLNGNLDSVTWGGANINYFKGPKLILSTVSRSILREAYSVVGLPHRVKATPKGNIPSFYPILCSLLEHGRLLKSGQRTGPCSTQPKNGSSYDLEGTSEKRKEIEGRNVKGL